MDITPAAMQAEATKRYLTDPLFHARVNIAIQLTDWSSQQNAGVNLNEYGQGLARQTAAFTLLAAELELPEDFVGDAVESMKAEAEKFGFTVVQQDVPAAF